MIDSDNDVFVVAQLVDVPVQTGHNRHSTERKMFYAGVHASNIIEDVRYAREFSSLKAISSALRGKYGDSETIAINKRTNEQFSLSEELQRKDYMITVNGKALKGGVYNHKTNRYDTVVLEFDRFDDALRYLSDKPFFANQNIMICDTEPKEMPKI